jgi:RNA polymerase sigma factor (sigma-70 family)
MMSDEGGGPVEDDKLVLEAKKGSRAAMELLVLRHYEEIHAYAARRTGSMHAAQDIAQATFEKLVRNLPDYRPIGRFRQWLFTVASNEVNDCYRRRRDMAPPPDDAPDDSDTVKLLIRREEYARVRRGVLSLPAGQQEALVLFYYHDMSLKDIALITGAPLNTVKSRLRLGLEKLRAGLEDECDEGQMV